MTLDFRVMYTIFLLYFSMFFLVGLIMFVIAIVVIHAHLRPTA